MARARRKYVPGTVGVRFKKPQKDALIDYCHERGTKLSDLIKALVEDFVRTHVDDDDVRDLFPLKQDPRELLNLCSKPKF